MTTALVLTENKTYHPNGKLKTHSFTSGSGVEGRFQGWYPDGQIWIDEFYIHSRQVGEQRRWYDNGQLEHQEFYDENGTRIGEQREWYKNGKLKNLCFYINGSKEGSQERKWDENGVLNYYHSGQHIGLDVVYLDERVEILEHLTKTLQGTIVSLQENSAKRELEMDETIVDLKTSLIRLDNETFWQRLFLGIILIILCQIRFE